MQVQRVLERTTGSAPGATHHQGATGNDAEVRLCKVPGGQRAGVEIEPPPSRNPVPPPRQAARLPGCGLLPTTGAPRTGTPRSTSAPTTPTTCSSTNSSSTI